MYVWQDIFQLKSLTVCQAPFKKKTSNENLPRPNSSKISILLNGIWICSEERIKVWSSLQKESWVLGENSWWDHPPPHQQVSGQDGNCFESLRAPICFSSHRSFAKIKNWKFKFRWKMINFYLFHSKQWGIPVQFSCSYALRAF